MYRQGIALFISLFWNPIVTQPNRLRQFKTSNDILPGDTTEIYGSARLKGETKLFCSTCASIDGSTLRL